jgi:hypothetical protein
VLNDDRADWREAYALFPGDVAYIWHGALHADVAAAGLAACGMQPVRSQQPYIVGPSDGTGARPMATPWT